MDSSQPERAAARGMTRFASFLVGLWFLPHMALGADMTNSGRELPRTPPGLDASVLALALEATECAMNRGEVDGETLTIIDYSLPSTERRLWTLDLESGEVLFHELVAHGINTGGNWARQFSNDDGSRQSSLGLFATADTYIGNNGYSLNLHGLEKGINDHALSRRIVMHGAWYVSEDLIRKQGRLGRSWGCPALDDEVAREVIDTVRDGSAVFIYYPESKWLDRSRYLSSCPSRRVS